MKKPKKELMEIGNAHLLFFVVHIEKAMMKFLVVMCCVTYREN